MISNSDVIVFVGDGWIVLSDAASLSTLNIVGTKNDGNPTIKGTDGDDSIDNTFSNVIIDAGSGNDTIFNNDSNVSISGGEGNDSINNEGYGKSVSIDAGVGNDYIYNQADNVSISGGKGNDSIEFDMGCAQNNLIQYSSGDGNDIIYEFNETSTLKIGDGTTDTYSTHLSGDNVIVSVGEGQITLAGAASLSALNIQGKEIILEPIWNISGTTATYGTTAETLITVNGVKSKDGLSVKDKVVTVAASSLNKGTVTISNGYTLKLADDVTTPQPTAAHWEHSGTTATYKNDYTSAGYSISNKQIVYSEATGGDTLITVKGVKSLGGVSLKDSVVTVSNSSLNQTAVTISNGYTLAFGSDVTQSVTTKEGWTFGSSNALYKSEHISTGYKLASNKISYLTESGGATLITVSGVKNSDGVSLDKTKKVVTVAETSLGTSKVTISDGYTLKLGNDVTKTEQKKVWSFDGESVATYKDATIAGYSLAADEKSIAYTKAASKTLATVTGVKSADGLTVSGDTITVSKKSLGTDKVTVSDGYKLALAPEVDN
ncbi:MAG: hypothetical protein IJP68_06645, partial [Selenomonadaceae bacterium]|nr:hypothetical protein [Selenomonadaceae bacterium]